MFTFINSLLIPALALALLPIIIHLMNRKRATLVPFSSLEFLKVLEKNKMKRLKVRQILLLILRSAILLLAVLAFMRPVSMISDRGDIATHHSTSVVLIVDNSMSSGYVSEKGSTIDRIKSKAIGILDFLKEGDEALLIVAGETPMTEFSHNFSEMKERVRSLAVRPAVMDLTEALHRAATLMGKARHQNKEIYVLSDMQENAFRKEPATFLTEASLVPVCVSFGVEEAGNRSVRRAGVVSRILERQKPLKIEAIVRQDGPSRGEGLLTMFLDGRRVGQTPAIMENGPDEKNHGFTVSSMRSGFVSGFAETEDDPLMADNRFYFHTYVPDNVRVLLVGPAGTETELLRLALAPSGDAATSVRVTQTTPSQFLSVSDQDFDVLIFCNMSTFSEAVLQRVEPFVRRGGGVIIFPGDALQMDAYNAGVMARLGFGRLVGSGSHDNTGLQFERIDADHPVISGLFESPLKEAKIESPSVYQSVKVLLSPTAAAPITLSDHTPFLIENRVGQGTAMFYSTAVDLSWSDWALKGLFPAILNRSVRYLVSSGFEDPSSFRSGEPVEFKQKNVSAENIHVTGPSGNEILPKVRLAGSEAVLQIPPLEDAGSYQVWYRGAVVRVFDVNVPEEESELKMATSEELDLHLGAGQYRLISETENIEEFILQSRFGREWWRWLLAGVLILALAEIGLAQSHRFAFKSNGKETL